MVETLLNILLLYKAHSRAFLMEVIMTIEQFIVRSFQIGVKLLNKENSTKEESEFLKLLDELGGNYAQRNHPN